VAATFAGTLMLGAPSAHAQQAPGASAAPDDNEMLYVGSIMGDDVYVRSGAAESYYPFFKVSRGDLVKVTGEKFGWTRVAIAGPAFADAFGYIKHARGDTSRFRISADGKSGTTLGRVDILAPNLDAGNQPKDSWKTLIRLEANQTVRVVESNDLGQEIVHKVSLPANVTGWISSQFVPHASAEDSELFKDILAGKIAPPEAAPGPTPEPAAKTPDSAVASHAGAAAQQASDQGVAPAGADSVLAGGAPTDVNTQAAPPEAPTTAPAVVAAASQPAKPKGPTFADLEARFEELRKEPVETAELMPLHDLYALYAKEHPNERAVQRRCDARMRQLSIWGELQIKKQEVAAAQERMKLSAEETAAVRDALERSAEYTAVGRIASSTIYDGSSLPKLFRIQDPATGRTVAYLKPDAEYTLANRVDMIVGIVGDKVYDETLRLNIITPRRIESLSPEKTAGAPTLTEPSEDK
jgi:hypothetical protein